MRGEPPAPAGTEIAQPRAELLSKGEVEASWSVAQDAPSETSFSSDRRLSVASEKTRVSSPVSRRKFAQLSELKTGRLSSITRKATLKERRASAAVGSLGPSASIRSSMVMVLTVPGTAKGSQR